MPVGRRGSPVVSVHRAAPGPASIISQGNFAGIDQGVDFRGRGPVPATDEAIVTDVSSSPIVEGGTYPVVVYRLLSGARAGRRVYVAENIRPAVVPGQHVQEGETVAQARGSYPYIEEGWNKTDTGWNPSAPFAGHSPTRAGRDFWGYLQTKLRGGAQPSGPSRETLEQLWLQAGGPANQARVAAAVALAESGGRENAKNRDSNGTTDYGLWQINSSHGYNPKRLLADPTYNATAAVAVWRTQGWQAWSTYTSGAYLQHLGQDPSVPVASRPPRPGWAGSGPASPGGDGSGDTAAADDAAGAAWQNYLAEGDNPPAEAPGATVQPAGLFSFDPNPLHRGFWLPIDPLAPFHEAQSAVSDVGTFLKWVAWLFHPRNVLRIVEFTAGGVLMLVGLRFLLEGLRTGGGRTPDRPAGVARSNVKRIVRATPPGRALTMASAAQEGRRRARSARRSAQVGAQREQRKRAVKAAQKRARQPGESRAAHRERRRGGDVPF